MNASEKEKIVLEHQAAKLFMRWYESITGREIRHIWHNQPQKPDVSCYLDGQRLDMEIAHLYGSEPDAMRILKRELSAKTKAELKKQAGLTNTDERLMEALHRILVNKSKKSYHSERVWLVIRNANACWDRQRIEALKSRIRVPANHPFEQIWIVCDMKGETGIVRLYPSREPQH
ncbi:hypothetical protein [Alteromonas sp. CYL-A6]|uniref:hypothetical protein n=1 Tax=Alteromonas nitratireducens TaxID=3390813 RepID=UPI0034BF75B9